MMVGRLQMGVGLYRGMVRSILLQTCGLQGRYQATTLLHHPLLLPMERAMMYTLQESVERWIMMRLDMLGLQTARMAVRLPICILREHY